MDALRTFVRVPSLTGEEGDAQKHVVAQLEALGADVTSHEPDVRAMFERFPAVAQYPTHWQHDLILPYADLPTFEALRASGLERVVNYRGRPNVVGVVSGTGGGRSLILNGHIDTVTVEPRHEWRHDPFAADVDGGYGGLVDDALMRATEFFLTIPSFVLAVVIVAIFSPTVVTVTRPSVSSRGRRSRGSRARSSSRTGTETTCRRAARSAPVISRSSRRTSCRTRCRRSSSCCR